MKIDKIMILTIVLLAILSFGAVSAQDDLTDNVASDDATISHETTQDSNVLSSDDNSKTVYVETTGSDSSEGGQNSPFATINKAISEVNASQKATIYIGEGTFTGENNTDLSINLAHKQNGGSLTIIGKGNGKTIIDADYEAPIFKSISADSIVYLVNITFTHGKNNLGSAITTSGDLTVDSCEFIKNEADAYAAIYQDDGNNLKVINSKFKDNTAKSGNAAIYFSEWGDNDYNVTIIGSSFENSTTTNSWADSSCIYIQAGNILVQGNTFANITGTGKGAALYVRGNNVAKVINNTFKDSSHDGTQEGAIIYMGNTYLEGNTFENCTSSQGAVIYSLLTYNAKIIFNDLSVNGTSFKLTANLTDDKGNTVNSYGDVIFYLNDEKVGTAKATSNGVATLSVSKILDNGQYTLTGTYSEDNKFDCEVTNGTVTVDFDHTPIDLWISPTGDDASGDGSKDKPFKTIKHALDYGLDKSIDVKVHLLNGLYNETGDFDLSYSQVAKISIIGESKEGAIISGNNNKGFLTSGQYTQVLLKNLTIVNLTGQSSRSFNVRDITFEDCIVNNVKILYVYPSPSYAVLRNVYWTNSANFQIYNAEIYNSHFENITSAGTGNFWLATSGDNVIIVENSKFINLTCSGNSGAGAFYVQGNFRSINNTYDNNKATSRSYGAVYVSGTKILSINDTFTNNYAEGDYGAVAFYVSSNDNPSVVIENAKFINNTAKGNGGALGIYAGQLINCTFENNKANKGGAIYANYYSNSIKLHELILTDVTFKNNNATNGKDIFIAPTTSSSDITPGLAGMTVTFNDLTTKELFDTVSADVTHESGAIIGGGTITFNLDGSYMGVTDLVNGKASLGYLGFTKDGSFVLSGDCNVAYNDTKYVNSTVTVALNPLKENVTLYVSPKGNDSNADGSLEKPFKTINAALESGYKQSKVIVVRVLEGNYSGEGNVNLTIFGSLDISIVGDGINKTIITGNATKSTWFIKLLTAGEGVLKLANMTVSEINYNYKAQNTQVSAIVAEKGTVLKIDTVEFKKNAGNNGGVINNAGDLEIINSVFFNNGDSNNGASVYNTGKTTVDNSKFIANHAKYYGDFFNSGELFIYNSLIQDSMRVNGWAGNGFAIGGSGNLTIINSTISRSGKKVLEIIEAGDTYANNPAFIISIASSGHILLDNVTIDGNNKAYTGPNFQVGANVGVTGTSSTIAYAPASLTVINSRFLNLNTAFSNQKNAVISTSYFENLTNLLTGTSFAGNVTIQGSYFADETVTLTKHAQSLINLSNNWWGDNEQPTYKASNVNTHPETWLILTLNVTEDGDVLLAFKSFDGENITDYDGAAYARKFNIDAVNATLKVNNGTISNSVVIPVETTSDTIYVNATVDGQKVNMTRKVLSISASTAPVYVGQTVIVEVTNPSELKNNITVLIDGKKYSAQVTGTKTIISIPDLAAGKYAAKVYYEVDDVYLVKSVEIDVKVIGIIINASDVEKYFNGSQKLNVTFTDDEGHALNNQSVTAVIGGNTLKATTDANGVASFDLDMGVGNYVAEISLNTTKAIANVVIKSTVPASSNESVIKVYDEFETTFMDSEGNPLANTNVTFDVDGKKINKTTDANGVAKLTKDEIGAGTNHTITVINPVTAEKEVYDVKSISIVINASDVEKYFKGSQNLNITVVDSEGNALANQSVTAVIGGNTLKATTDANGVASFDLDLAVGKYVAEISLFDANATANVVIKSTAPASGNGSVINVDNGFETTFMDSEGKPLANTTVTFDVDGKKINKTTDASGVAKLTKAEIGADGTNHTITVTNPATNETVSYNVTISKAPTPTPTPVVQKIVLKAKKTIKIKKSAKKLVLKATLKIDGKKAKGKVIKFKFKGKTYKAKTNKKGVAKVTIKKKVIKKLKKGKKYAAKITYGNKSAKTIVKVKK